MRSDEAGRHHRAFVRGWLEGVAPSVASLPLTQLVSLFERSMGALWRRAESTLGEVTVAAIADRVLYTASERYSFLSSLKIGQSGVTFDEFRLQGGAGRHEGDLPEVIRLVLSEFLTVLGNPRFT